MLQLNPTIPVRSKKHNMNGYAFLVLIIATDRPVREQHLFFVVALDNGETAMLKLQDIEVLNKEKKQPEKIVFRDYSWYNLWPKANTNPRNFMGSAGKAENINEAVKNEAFDFDKELEATLASLCKFYGIEPSTLNKISSADFLTKKEREEKFKKEWKEMIDKVSFPTVPEESKKGSVPHMRNPPPPPPHFPKDRVEKGKTISKEEDKKVRWDKLVKSIIEKETTAGKMINLLIDSCVDKEIKNWAKDHLKTPKQEQVQLDEIDRLIKWNEKIKNHLGDLEKRLDTLPVAGQDLKKEKEDEKSTGIRPKGALKFTSGWGKELGEVLGFLEKENGNIEVKVKLNKKGIEFIKALTNKKK